MAPEVPPARRSAGVMTPVAEGAGAVAAALFGALSAVRRRRVFHPRGTAYDATLLVHGGGRGAALLDEPARRPCVVRLSRGIGLREPLPDILGVALRVPDAYGPGAHQDLLMTTAGEGPVLRSVLGLARSPDRGHYSSVLPYRIGDDHAYVGARPVAPGPSGPRFSLEVAPPLGDWQEVALLELGRPWDDAASDALRFNPFFTGGGIEPAGALQTLRRRAYAGSQAARPQ
ncbi:MAG: hypothetical protein K0R11_1032 [Acidimicrobiales bacterium]|nr:hypothetical protein [Acidimicrobiales bacterium]